MKSICWTIISWMFCWTRQPRAGISLNAKESRSVIRRDSCSSGSGNPEEGELRPQLLDRFGLYTQITTITDLDQRVEIVERRERFDDDPAAFEAEFAAAEDQLRKQITRAKKLLARVEVDRRLLMSIAELCVSLKVDGHRGELTIARAARALAAFEGRTRANAG